MYILIRHVCELALFTQMLKILCCISDHTLCMVCVVCGPFFYLGDHYFNERIHKVEHLIRKALGGDEEPDFLAHVIDNDDESGVFAVFCHQ